MINLHIFIVIMKYPDNIVFNYEEESFDAFKKDYPTTSSSPNFGASIIDKNLPYECKNYFKSKIEELKEQYNKIQEEYNWTELIYKSQYSFKPISGATYHLYQTIEKKNFLSIIEPENWKQKYIGSFMLMSNGMWTKK